MVTLALVIIIGTVIGWLVAEALCQAWHEAKANRIRRDIGLQPKPVSIYGILKETPRKVGM